MSRRTRLSRLFVAMSMVAGILSCNDAQPLAPEAGHSVSTSQVGVAAAGTSVTITLRSLSTGLTVGAPATDRFRKGCIAEVCKALAATNATLEAAGLELVVSPAGTCPDL